MTANVQADERQLILGARSGDKEAFGELVKLHQARIFFLCLRLTRNTEDAKELAQEAFISAYQAIKGFRLRSSFYTWIYRIALNLCYRRLRSAQYRVKLKSYSLDEPAEGKDSVFLKEISSSLPNPSEEFAEKEKAEIIRSALGSLGRAFYQAVVLRDLEGLSYEEIAKIQHCSLGTVMSRLYRGRIQLADKLKKSGINLA